MNNNREPKQRKTGKTPAEKQAEEQTQKAEIAEQIEKQLDRYYAWQEEAERRREDTEEAQK